MMVYIVCLKEIRSQIHGLRFIVSSNTRGLLKNKFSLRHFGVDCATTLDKGLPHLDEFLDANTHNPE